tara:strand:+ start:228 stop:506 length:279 start_codon:yes stop_codon:yes gene_type:complete
MKTYWVWWRFVNNSPKQPIKIEANTVDEAIKQSTIYDPKVRSPKGERMHFIVFKEVVCAGATELIVEHSGPVEDGPSFIELLFGGTNGSTEE